MFFETFRFSSTAPFLRNLTQDWSKYCLQVLSQKYEVFGEQSLDVGGAVETKSCSPGANSQVRKILIATWSGGGRERGWFPCWFKQTPAYFHVSHACTQTLDIYKFFMFHTNT